MLARKIIEKPPRAVIIREVKSRKILGCFKAIKFRWNYPKGAFVYVLLAVDKLSCLSGKMTRGVE